MSPSCFHLDHLHLPSRPAHAREELLKILSALVEDFGAEKIIAFGSCVRGGATEHSDVDLCVVRKHPPHCTKPRWEGRMAVARRAPLLAYDLLVLDPDQWTEQTKHPFGVYQEVVKEGVTLYER